MSTALRQHSPAKACKPLYHAHTLTPEQNHEMEPKLPGLGGWMRQVQLGEWGQHPQRCKHTHPQDLGVPRLDKPFVSVRRAVLSTAADG